MRGKNKMKMNRFDVIELNDGNNATILDIKSDEYLAEIVNKEGITLGYRNIEEDEIKNILF